MSPKVRFPLTTATVILAVSLLAAAGAPAAPKMKVLHSFGALLDGAGLYGGLAFDPKGNLYGGTSGGGLGGAGITYQLAPQRDGTWKETILRSFSYGDPDSDEVMGTFVSDAHGNVYGTLNQGGGSATYGTVFALAPGGKGWTFAVMYRFHGGDTDSHPTGPLIMDAKGNLYGTAYWPFELSHSGSEPWTFTLLRNSGPGSNGGLARDQSGNLYGTTPQGGTSKGCGGGCGTAYELHRDSKGNWDTYILHNFDPVNDRLSYPNGVLAVDTKGNLYGAAAGGGGKGQTATALYELSPGPDGWRVAILHSFEDDAGAITGPVFDRAGNMYGMTTGGGDGGCGVIYKMTPPGPSLSWTYTVLHSFTYSEGCQPEDRPTLDDKGNIYGTTISGGAYFAGTAFEFTP